MGFRLLNTLTLVLYFLLSKVVLNYLICLNLLLWSVKVHRLGKFKAKKLTLVILLNILVLVLLLLVAHRYLKLVEIRIIFLSRSQFLLSNTGEWSLIVIIIRNVLAVVLIRWFTHVLFLNTFKVVYWFEVVLVKEIIQINRFVLRSKMFVFVLDDYLLLARWGCKVVWFVLNLSLLALIVWRGKFTNLICLILWVQIVFIWIWNQLIQ